MKKVFYIIGLILIVQAAFGQHVVLDTVNDAYNNNLASAYSIKSKATLKSLDTIGDRKIRMAFKKMYEENSAEFLKEISDRKFVYHKEISPLITAIVDEIKAKNPAANFDDIQILLSLDESNNAYNMGENIVIINLPLVLNVADTYQLSYVICHEIAHQHLDHVFKALKSRLVKSESREVVEKTKQIKKIKYNQNTLATAEIKNFVYDRRKFSRINEHQADSLGFIYFKNAYPEQIIKSLEALLVLKEIDKESDSLVLEDYKKIFKNTSVKFQDNWLQTDILSSYNYQKNSKTWDVDSLRTHPDIDVRVDFLKENFKITDAEVKRFIDLKFATLKSNARYDEITMLYFLKEYGKSLYKTMILLKNDKENVLLKMKMFDNFSKIEAYRKKYILNRCLETESPNFTKSYNTYLSFVRNLTNSQLTQILKHYEY
ncbi:M48 family metalloprotease [Flavobacterium tegetincola]|uniref:M48 family metalloprotease n=1 Tax=Flavobacterium tegetincola TaxID=150172 RepID=UPI0003FB9DAC|nr:M48 family metalloprotease [Flavobacterium tegetincola]